MAISYFFKTFHAKMKENEKLLQYYNTGTNLADDSPTSCDTRGQIKHISIKTFMTKANLSVDFQKKHVRNAQGMVLPCGRLEGGCES